MCVMERRVRGVCLRSATHSYPVSLGWGLCLHRRFSTASTTPRLWSVPAAGGSIPPSPVLQPPPLGGGLALMTILRRLRVSLFLEYKMPVVLNSAVVGKFPLLYRGQPDFLKGQGRCSRISLSEPYKRVCTCAYVHAMSKACMYTLELCLFSLCSMFFIVLRAFFPCKSH